MTQNITVKIFDDVKYTLSVLKEDIYLGDALKELMKKVNTDVNLVAYRKGWNGKNIWVQLTPANTYKDDSGYTIHNLAHLDMKTATGEMCIGWLASQTDQLTDDWVVAEIVVRLFKASVFTEIEI